MQPSSVDNNALYDGLADVYDMVYSDAQDNLPFVEKILRNFGAKRVLEVGCGTGLFTIPLHQKGFEIEGLEISRGMIQMARGKCPSLKIHQGDMRSFSLPKKFDAVLALSSTLTLVSSWKGMRQSVWKIYDHLRPRGIALLELPNHPVEIAQKIHSQEVHCDESLSRIVVIQGLLTKKYWREYWHILRTTEKSFDYRKVTCDELLYAPHALEGELEKLGMRVVQRYGDLLGAPFNEETSWRRVLIVERQS